MSSHTHFHSNRIISIINYGYSIILLLIIFLFLVNREIDITIPLHRQAIPSEDGKRIADLLRLPPE